MRLTGRLRWLAGLALAWGIQLTIGHFQIQMWTAGLVILSGIWRIWIVKLPWQRGLAAACCCCAALCWGLSIAWVQFRLTWEMTGVAGFVRPAHVLLPFSFPPAHWRNSRYRRCFSGSTTVRVTCTGTGTRRWRAKPRPMLGSWSLSWRSWARRRQPAGTY